MQSNSLFYLLFLIPIIMFTACGSGSTSSSDDLSNYTLRYDEVGKSITGQFSFDMGNIPSNHTVKLSDFTPSITGCDIDYVSSSFTPDEVSFTSTTTTGVLIADIKLYGACSNPKLQLKAKYTDSSVLDNKFFTYTDDVTYDFDVEVTTPVNSYTLVLQTSAINLTKNSETRTIVVSVYDQNNIPATSGNVNIVYPAEASNGVDVGSFTPASAAIENGKAIFNYTGPSDLSSLVDAGKSATSFQFYYENELTKAVKLSINYVPDENQIVITSYKILFNPQDDSSKMSLSETKPFSVSIVDRDENVVSDSDLYELNISLENTAIASLIDSSGTTGTTLKYQNKNNITASLASGTISGLVPLKVSAYFKDVNDKNISINDTFNVIIESGPPTAISFSYVGTNQDKDRAKFIEKFAISVTDKYFNPVNTNPSVSVGAIVGYARHDDGNIHHRIFVDSGTLAILDSNTLALNQNLIDVATTDIDIYNDTLVTFGNGYTYPASGGWSFTGFNESTITLEEGQYDGNRTTNIGYAIGRNYRQDTCDYGREWVGQTKLIDNVTTLDEKGTAIMELSYDYYLVGKSIVVYANIIGQDNKLGRKLKMGEALKHTLRGHGVEILDDTTISVKGTETSTTTTTRRFYAWIKDTVEPYRNARFGLSQIKTSGDGDINSVRHMSIEECNNRGHAYVEYTITADINSTYSITVSNPFISSEF